MGLFPGEKSVQQVSTQPGVRASVFLPLYKTLGRKAGSDSSDRHSPLQHGWHSGNGDFS